MYTSVKIMLAVSAVMVLFGCAIPPANMEGYREVKEPDGLPVLGADVFKGTTPARAMFADLMIREEYARYEANGARAEVFYVTPRHENIQFVALNHRHDSSTVASLFNYFNSRKVESPPGVRARNGLAEFWYRIVTLPDDNRQCMVFNSEWELHHEDALLRPDKVMFGYFCPASGGTLDKAVAGKIIGGVGVRDINVRYTGDSLEVAGPASPDKQSKLAQLARGEGSSGQWGAASFPFDMAAPYSPSGPSDWE